MGLGPAKAAGFFFPTLEPDTMWKIALAFVVFAAFAMYVLMQKGGDVSLAGEQHGGDVAHAASAPASAASQ